MSAVQSKAQGVSRRAVMASLAAFGALGVAPRRAAASISDFVVIGKDDWLFAIYDEVHRTDVPRMKVCIQLINEAVGVMKKAGIETVISLTPAKARIYRDYLPADFLFDAESEKRYAVALDLLRAPGTLVPDLATVLLDQRKAHPDVPLFLTADTHWTAPAAEAAAVEVARQIKAKMHLPASAKPGTQLGPVITMRQASNDLAEGLPDAMGAKYRPQLYPLHQAVQAAGGSALLADDTADVLVVGNSFMQPKYGFAAMLSNQLERPVSLTWKVHQSSPYRTLLAALGSDEFRRQKPKLLVWDFEETDMQKMIDESGVWGQNVMAPQAFLSTLRSTVGA